MTNNNIPLFLDPSEAHLIELALLRYNESIDKDQPIKEELDGVLTKIQTFSDTLKKSTPKL